MFPGPVIKCHISDVHRREAIYHKSLESTTATAVIAGLGAEGYATAVSAARNLVNQRRLTLPFRKRRDHPPPTFRRFSRGEVDAPGCLCVFNYSGE